MSGAPLNLCFIDYIILVIGLHELANEKSLPVLPPLLQSEISPVVLSTPITPSSADWSMGRIDARFCHNATLHCVHNLGKIPANQNSTSGEPITEYHWRGQHETLLSEERRGVYCDNLAFIISTW